MQTSVYKDHLLLIGTPSDPITFTSVNDNSVGGITGTGSPVAGDSPGIGVENGGSLTGTNLNIRYSSTALFVDATSSATVQGSIGIRISVLTHMDP